MLARLYHRVGMGQKATELLEAHTSKYPEAMDLTDINILSELYMEGGQYDRAAALIRSAQKQLCASGLPIDLTASIFMPLHQEPKYFARAALDAIAWQHLWCSLRLVVRGAEQLCSMLVQVKAATCQMHLGDMPTALDMFEGLHLESPIEYADLYMDVGDLLADQKEHHRVCAGQRNAQLFLKIKAKMITTIITS